MNTPYELCSVNHFFVFDKIPSISILMKVLKLGSSIFFNASSIVWFDFSLLENSWSSLAYSIQTQLAQPLMQHNSRGGGSGGSLDMLLNVLIHTENDTNPISCTMYYLWGTGLRNHSLQAHHCLQALRPTCFESLEVSRAYKNRHRLMICSRGTCCQTPWPVSIQTNPPGLFQKKSIPHS